jgi:hypothetical protein
MTTDQLAMDTVLASRRQAVAQASDTFNALTDEELDAMFIKNPDKVINELSTAANLKNYWAEVNHNVLPRMEPPSPRECSRRHTAMTDEDLTNDPTRNRLNILLRRARHVSYHLGQAALARN